MPLRSHLCDLLSNSCCSQPIKRGYFRFEDTSIDVRRCPDASTNCTDAPECPESSSGCKGTMDVAIGGGDEGASTAEPSFSSGRRLKENSTTAAGCYHDLAGPFCRLCARHDDGPAVRLYYSAATTSQRAQCRVCRETARDSILSALGWLALAAVVALLFRTWYVVCASPQQRSALGAAWKIYTPHNKTKILVGFYMIATKIDEVYEVSMPPAIRRLMTSFAFTVSFGVSTVGTVLECLDLSGYVNELAVYVVRRSQRLHLSFDACQRSHSTLISACLRPLRSCRPPLVFSSPWLLFCACSALVG